MEKPDKYVKIISKPKKVILTFHGEMMIYLKILNMYYICMCVLAFHDVALKHKLMI